MVWFLLSVVGEALVTGSMLYMIAVYNPLYCFAVGWVLELFFDVIVVVAQSRLEKRNFDLTALSDLKEFIQTRLEKVDGPWWRRLRRWGARGLQLTLRSLGIQSYFPMVFIWSVWHIEPDYVTILLRGKGEPVWNVIDRVLLPAVTWSIAVWTVVFYLAAEGVRWAIALAS